VALLNSDYIRKLIRTGSQPTNFTILSETVSNAFRYDMEAVTTTAYLSGLLERGVPILIYAGTYDAAASWLDNERMTRIVEWSGQQDFVSSPMREWEVNGFKAGQVRSSKLLTFASIYAAGHMVCRLARSCTSNTVTDSWIRHLTTSQSRHL
jgi:carboxypeptidase C (cathepsin A)